MTTPDERLPEAGPTEPGSGHDPEQAEAYAESVGVDPTPDEIDHYLAIAGAAPLADQSDPTQVNDVDE